MTLAPREAIDFLDSKIVFFLTTKRLLSKNQGGDHTRLILQELAVDYAGSSNSFTDFVKIRILNLLHNFY